MSAYTYNTNDDHDRQDSVPRDENSRTFETHFPAANIPLGLNMINIKPGIDYRIRSYIDGIEPVDNKYEAFKATVHLDTWSPGTLLGAGCTWLDVSKWDRGFQFGRVPATGELTDGHPYISDITFERPFEQVPKIVVWLHTLNIHSRYEARIWALAKDVTATGFKLDVHTWKESHLFDCKVSWVAVPQNWPNVTAGNHIFNGDGNPLPEFKTQITSDKPFKRAPRVLVALNKIHAYKTQGLQIEAKAENVTPEGMTLSIKSWHGCAVFEAGVAYIAIEIAD
ncbi:hypothetical protein RSAG8_04661, partial [Rhizoctonia solani AG-8 WAC10335]